MTKIVLIGEAWGEQEDIYKFPFVGSAGQELYRILRDAGFPLTPPSRFIPPHKLRDLWKASGITLLNVFNSRPPNNAISSYFGKAAEDVDREFPPMAPGQFVLKSKSDEVRKLRSTLLRTKPNLTVCLGNTALWAVLGLTKISNERGAIHLSQYGKVLPTFHPAAILRQWDLRVLAVADFMKAFREQESSTFQQEQRFIYYNPTLSDLDWFWENHLSKSPLITVDIETEANKQISEIGFGSDANHTLHLPFMITHKRGPRIIKCDSYWRSVHEERKAWEFVRDALASPIPKLFQNGVYDRYWLRHFPLHINVNGICEDTMLVHHALYPELNKGLGFLGSIYMNEPAWKHLRRESNKAGE